MLNTPKELLSILDELNIEYVNTEHPPVFTVEEADRHHEGIEGAHSKNLFFKDKKKRLFLVITLDHKAIKIKEVAKTIGAKTMSFGKPDLLMEILGVSPGSVTPFAAVNIPKDREVRIILDEEMMEKKILNFHPLVNTATTTISSTDLLRFLAHVGQEPEIIRL